jgi:MFS family permease
MSMTVSAQTIGRGEALPRESMKFIIAASSVGTLIEWYDFYLYGTLAVFFSGLFFPAGSPTVNLLISLATFATGFMVRPFGAVLFGRLGDLIGRKFTFLLTLIIMGSATTLIGFLPSYASIGMAAPVILVTLRLLQGLALGGEYGGAATYIAEHAPDGKRGAYTSWIQMTATVGLLVSLLVVLGCRLWLGDEVFKDWGWRIPFALSAVLVVLSVYIRMRLQESPLYQAIKDSGKASSAPLKDAFGSASNLRLMLLALFGATAPEGVVWYTGQFYALYFLLAIMKVNYVTAYIIVAVAVTAATPFFYVFGAWSDKIGRRNIMVAGFALAVLTYIPVYMWMRANPDNPVLLTILVFYQCILVTMVYGPIAAYLVEIFPARIRYTSMSFPYHIGNGVFGGLVPLIGLSLISATGNNLAGLAYPMLVAAIGVVVAMMFMGQTHLVKIWDEVGHRK